MNFCYGDLQHFFYLAQRYIYRIDPTRVNEFGFSQEMEKEAREKKEAGEGTTPETQSIKSAEEKKKELV